MASIALTLLQLAMALLMAINNNPSVTPDQFAHATAVANQAIQFADSVLGIPYVPGSTATSTLALGAALASSTNPGGNNLTGGANPTSTASATDPTITLTVNGSSSATLHAGDGVKYAWRATNADHISGTITGGSTNPSGVGKLISGPFNTCNDFLNFNPWLNPFNFVAGSFPHLPTTVTGAYDSKLKTQFVNNVGQEQVNGVFPGNGAGNGGMIPDVKTNASQCDTDLSFTYTMTATQSATGKTASASVTITIPTQGAYSPNGSSPAVGSEGFTNTAPGPVAGTGTGTGTGTGSGSATCIPLNPKWPPCSLQSTDYYTSIQPAFGVENCPAEYPGVTVDATSAQFACVERNTPKFQAISDWRAACATQSACVQPGLTPNPSQTPSSTPNVVPGVCGSGFVNGTPLQGTECQSGFPNNLQGCDANGLNCTWYCGETVNGGGDGNFSPQCNNDTGSHAASSPSSASRTTSINTVQGYDPTSGNYTAGTALLNTYLVLFGNFATKGNTVFIDGMAQPTPSYLSTSQINISLAGIALGSHAVGVTNLLGSASAQFTVIGRASSGSTAGGSNPSGNTRTSGTQTNSGTCAATNCNAATPACGTRTTGIDSCGKSCFKAGSVCGGGGGAGTGGGSNLSCIGQNSCETSSGGCSVYDPCSVCGGNGSECGYTGWAGNGFAMGGTNGGNSTTGTTGSTGSGTASKSGSSCADNAQGDSVCLANAICKANNGVVTCTCNPGYVNGTNAAGTEQVCLATTQNGTCEGGATQPCTTGANACGMENDGYETCNIENTWNACDASAKPPDSGCVAYCQQNKSDPDCQAFLNNGNCTPAQVADCGSSETCSVSAAGMVSCTGTGSCITGITQSCYSFNSCNQSTYGSEICTNGKWPTTCPAQAPSENDCPGKSSSACSASDAALCAPNGCSYSDGTVTCTVDCNADPGAAGCPKNCASNPNVSGCTSGSPDCSCDENDQPQCVDPDTNDPVAVSSSLVDMCSSGSSDGGGTIGGGGGGGVVESYCDSMKWYEDYDVCIAEMGIE